MNVTTVLRQTAYFGCPITVIYFNSDFLRSNYCSLINNDLYVYSNIANLFKCPCGVSSITIRGFDAWNNGPQVLHMQINTSIWDVALQVIISMLWEHIFNAEIVQINGEIIPLCFAAGSRRKKSRGTLQTMTELWV